MKNVAAGANPMDVKKGIKTAVDTAIDTVVKNSKKVSGSDDIARVATVSSGDEVIGKLIAEAMSKVTADGVITVEESKPPKHTPRLLRVCSSTADTLPPIW